jgi:hypothetical protein
MTTRGTLVEFEAAPDYMGNDQWQWTSFTIMNLIHVAWASPSFSGATSVKMVGDGASMIIRVQYEDFKGMWRKALGLS